MSLQFFNSDRQSKDGKKDYLKPNDIISDAYLTPAQKYIVLEAMLAEARDLSEDNNNGLIKQNIKLAEEILRAQSLLKKQMD